MANETYNLVCQKCRHWYSSKEAFPKDQFCYHCMKQLKPYPVADDVTMDCTKCKAHIEAEVLKRVGEWLETQRFVRSNEYSNPTYVIICQKDIDTFRWGEMP